jgi:uncharacterized OB-fold protein
MARRERCATAGEHHYDPDKLRIGDKVEVVFEKVSDTLAVPRFRPI